MDLANLCNRAKSASRSLAAVKSDQKDFFLSELAKIIITHQEDILAANKVDQHQAELNGLSPVMVDRLTLDSLRLAALSSDIQTVIGLPDPVGEVFDNQVLPNGLLVQKQRVPIGLLAVIYESRPNVTLDIASLTIKSGNAAILRGGSETLNTNRVLMVCVKSALKFSCLSEDSIVFIDSSDRKLVLDLLKMDGLVDMVIPRGGAGLHDFCRKNSRIPVITGGIGICHLFIDQSADLHRSLEVIRNAKIQRPTVCNALDTVLVHRSIAKEFLPQLVVGLSENGVEFRVDESSLAILGDKAKDYRIQPAGLLDFDTEWLGLVLGIRVVGGLEEAIEHINKHSTFHSDGILTADKENAKQFVARVDSAAVYVNASTRFTDGSQLGLGAEVAISTQRLHARGPMGLRELTTYKWVIQGDYSVRI